jgi:hypothetical protein
MTSQRARLRWLRSPRAGAEAGTATRARHRGRLRQMMPLERAGAPHPLRGSPPCFWLAHLPLRNERSRFALRIQTPRVRSGFVAHPLAAMLTAEDYKRLSKQAVELAVPRKTHAGRKPYCNLRWIIWGRLSD